MKGLPCNMIKLKLIRSVLSAGRYHDTSEEGKFYAVVLEFTQGVQEAGPGSPMGELR